MSTIITNESLEMNLSIPGNDDNKPQSSSPAENTEGRRANKAQPWKKIWPSAKPAGTQMQVYGFKKGEVMEILGNAGNFFAHGDWELEHDTSKGPESKTTDSFADKTSVGKNYEAPSKLLR